MKIFVGWPYDADWIETYAIPIIESYGVEVITGKELQGQVITSGVRDNIASSDAAVFFTTRREDAGAYWKTSDWVIDEVKHAKSIEKRRVLEIREAGVDYADKIHEARQYIIFQPEDRLGCLRDLAKAVSSWTVLSFTLKLQPQEFITNARARLRRKEYRCSYMITRQGRELIKINDVTIRRNGEALVIYVNDLPSEIFSYPDAQIEVEVEMGDEWWSATRLLRSYDIALENL